MGSTAHVVHAAEEDGYGALGNHFCLCCLCWVVIVKCALRRARWNVLCDGRAASLARFSGQRDYAALLQSEQKASPCAYCWKFDVMDEEEHHDLRCNLHGSFFLQMLSLGLS
mmetsp:Transcript_9106/g.13596  ORF Transcript_9106/g.13596 Transcript_9106/m.13596 type:complete len:112 (-) Transcript_9106:897-1232(-)